MLIRTTRTVIVVLMRYTDEVAMQHCKQRLAKQQQRKQQRDAAVNNSCPPCGVQAGWCR